MVKEELKIMLNFFKKIKEDSGELNLQDLSIKEELENKLFDF